MHLSETYRRIFCAFAVFYAIFCIFLGGYPLRSYLPAGLLNGKIAIVLLAVCILWKRGHIPRPAPQVLLEGAILAVILAVASFFRFYGIAARSAWKPTVDEPLIMSPVLNMIHTGNLDPVTYEYGGVWFYLLLAILSFTILREISTFAYKETIAIPDGVFYAAARYAVAAISVLTVGLTYATARRFFGKLPAIIAALLLALSSLSFLTAHEIRLDVALALFVLAAHYYFLRILEEPSAMNYWLAGIFCGLALGTKYTVVSIIVSLLLTHALAQRGKRLLNWNLVLALGSAAVVFFIFNIFSFLHLNEFLVRLPQAIYHNLTPEHWSAARNSPLRYFKNLMYAGPGVLGMLAALYSLVQMFVTRDDRLLVLWCFPLLLLATLGSYASGFPRYLMPLIPLFAILAGVGTQLFLQKLAARFPAAASPRAAVLATLIMIVLPVIAAVQYTIDTTRAVRPETIVNWIKQNVPPGSSIVVDSTGPVIEDRNYDVREFSIPEFRNGRKLRAAEYVLVPEDLFRNIPPDFHVVKEFPAQTKSLDRYYRIYKRP